MYYMNEISCWVYLQSRFRLFVIPKLRIFRHIENVCWKLIKKSVGKKATQKNAFTGKIPQISGMFYIKTRSISRYQLDFTLVGSSSKPCDLLLDTLFPGADVKGENLRCAKSDPMKRVERRDPWDSTNNSSKSSGI